VTFRIDAPDAQKVFLVGDFNGWDDTRHPMNKGREGSWSKAVMVVPGRYEYKFMVDGEWHRDPANPEVCENCFGTLNSVILVG
jgi:1,4-alpha-glucan branching enzyme